MKNDRTTEAGYGALLTVSSFLLILVSGSTRSLVQLLWIGVAGGLVAMTNAALRRDRNAGRSQQYAGAKLSSDNNILRLRALLFRVWFGLWPLLLGIVLPYVPFPGGVRLFNLFWDGVYGLGLWILDEAGWLSVASPFSAFGVFVWPIVVTFAIGMIGSRVQASANEILRRAVVIAMIASTAATGPLAIAYHPVAVWMPSYLRYFGAIW